MKIMYLSVHGILEYDEVRMFNDLGVKIFSPNGNYESANSSSPFRPKIENFNIDQEDYIEYKSTWNIWDWNMVCPKRFVDRFDVVYVMGFEKFIFHNWESFKHKPIIWRTIGQSNKNTERLIGDLKRKNSNLKIVRYSPTEKNCGNYAGEDAVIRFGKRTHEWCGWNGREKQLVTVVQSMKRRHAHCAWDVFESVSKVIPCKLFGGDNPEVDSSLNHGSPGYEQLINVYKDHRAYFYAGTVPANYTLNFIEAWMTGIPVIALNANMINDDKNGVYEIPRLIEHGVNGFLANDIFELMDITTEVFNDDILAKSISEKGRETAISHFDETKIKNEWNNFFKTL